MLKNGLILASLIAICCFYLSACGGEQSSAAEEVITIAQQNVANTLFYSGTIQPLKSVVITTPAEGVVVEMPFQYGEYVKPGQLLFMISSAKFLSDYKSSLLAYVKAKSEFNNAQMQLKEAKFLLKNELIARDDFKMKESNYFAAQLGFIQAKDTLETLLKQLADKDINLEALSIANIEKITAAMHLQMSSENLRIVSPASGIVLSASKSDEDSKKISKGDAVKQGDVLAIIGDMSGLSVRIKVNELTVNQLKVGQKVKVTGLAFPDHVLAGKVERIDRQGEASSGGLPSFTVQIIVPKLALDEQKTIHVGMTAKVEIAIQEEQQIMIPIGAINEKNGISFVKVVDAKSKKTKEIEVKTGKTTATSVAILSGLKTGDKIVSTN